MSVVLNGSTQYLATTTVYDTYPFSVVGWFKADNLTHNPALASLDKFGSTANAHLIQGLGGASVRAMTYVSSWAVATTTAGYAAGAWHHFVAVYAAQNDRRIYVDGGNKGTNATAKALTGCANFLLGARAAASPTSHFAGRLAECAVYNIALSDANAASLADGVNSPADVAAANLVYYWPLLEDANDDQGSNNLTAYNSPTFDSNDHPLAGGDFLNASATIACTSGLSAGAELAEIISGSYDTGKTKRLLVAVGNNRLFYEDV